MENEIKKPVPAVKSDKPDIPKGPWTLEALGPVKYRELAIAYAGFDPQSGIGGKTYFPALDLTSVVGEG